MSKLPAPWLDKVGSNGFQPGHSRSGLVKDLSELTDCFADYREEQEENGHPMDLYSWFSYGARHLGIGRRWWRKVMTSDPAAPKLEGLRETCVVIEDIIAGRLASEALRGEIHPGLAGQQLQTMENRDQLVAEREDLARKEEDTTPATPPEQIANIVHPDMTAEQYDACIAASVQPPLYSQQQLESGMPLFLPIEVSDG